MAVEPALTAGIGARSQGGANATKNAGNGGVERENRADRGVAGALTHSSELYRTRGTHRARLSASTRCGRTRRSRWWSRRRGRSAELAGREAPNVATMVRSGAAAAARERERGRERERRGANGSGDEGGRGRALLESDRGASRLPHARHTAVELCRRATAARRGPPRASMARAWARGRARAGWAGFGQWARSEAAAC